MKKCKVCCKKLYKTNKTVLCPKCSGSICKEEDCSKKITVSSKSGRCGSCSQKGNRSSVFIDGRTNAIYYCKEENCKNVISYSNHLNGKGRCQSCSSRERYKNIENHPRLKDIESTKVHYCIDCNNKISYLCWKNGSKRCISCSAKARYKDPKKHPSYKGGLVEVKCDWCNKTKKVKRKELKIEFHFCDTKCHGKWISKNKLKDNNSNWQGGKSFEIYPEGWTKNFKETIRERDNRLCQECYKPEKENGRKLDVHHIDYNKENLDIDNLTSLCRTCHGKANGNRPKWTKHFQNLLYGETK